MGSIGSCAKSCCCVAACPNKIAQIKLTLGTGYSPLIFTRDVDAPLTQDCLVYLLAGDWCNYLTDDKGTGSCSRLGTMRDCRVTITHDTASVNPLIFSCPRFDGSGWYPGSATIQTTTLSDGAVREYYWPNEIFANGIETGTYNGTAFTFRPGSHWNATNVCLSDIDLAAAIKASLVTSLGGVYPEFTASRFDVAVTRDGLTCGSSLDLYGQSVVITAKCGGLFGSDCWNVTMTKSTAISAAVVELTRNSLKVTFLQRHLKSMAVGTNCNSPPRTTPPIDDVLEMGVSKVGFQIGLPYGIPAVECFSSYDFSMTLPGIIFRPWATAEFPTCDGNDFDVVVGNIDGTADPVTFNGRVELIYA